DGPTETYALPVKLASGDAARSISQAAPHAIIARFGGSRENILFDAICCTRCRSQFLTGIVRGEKMKARAGELVGTVSKTIETDQPVSFENSEVLAAEQSNSSMLFDNKFFLKLYRKLEDGINPDVELTRFLTEHTEFENVPAFVGALEYRRAK